MHLARDNVRQSSDNKKSQREHIAGRRKKRRGKAKHKMKEKQEEKVTTLPAF